MIRQPRRGYSLIEMIFVITAVSLVLGLCTAMIHGLMKLNKSAQMRLAENTTLDRLGRQFRQDAHAATQAVASPDGVELKEADRSIKYERRQGVLYREERAGGQNPHVDFYRLPTRGAPRLQTSERDGGNWVALVFERVTDPARLVPAYEFRIDALVGRDHRPTTVAGDKP